jgi:hypothetical protein
MRRSNTVEMGVTVGEAEIGGVPEARSFVASGAHFLRDLAGCIDPTHRVVADRHGRGRAFDDRRSGAGGEQDKSCNAGSALLPEPSKPYFCHMIHIAENLPAGR